MKTSIKRTFGKTLAIFLSLLMVFYAVPESVLALLGAASDTVISSEADELSPADEVYVLGEVVSLRSESAKHFRMSDGSYVAVEYGKPVHFIDDDDAWQDYDNTLDMEAAKSSGDISGFISSRNDLKIKFANNSNSSSLIQIKNSDYSISLNLLGASKGKAIAVNNPLEAQRSENGKLKLEEAVKLTKYSSSVVYENILENTDLEYIVHGNNLKENIIVKARGVSYIYEFNLDLTGLVAVLNEDGSISLLDDKTSELQFTIPAGYMFDANGMY